MTKTTSFVCKACGDTSAKFADDISTTCGYCKPNSPYMRWPKEVREEWDRAAVKDAEFVASGRLAEWSLTSFAAWTQVVRGG